MAQGDLSACSATQCQGVCSLGDASEQIKYWQASRSSLLTEGRVPRTMQPGYPANSSCKEEGSQDCIAVPHHLQSPPAWGEASGHYFPHFRVFMAWRQSYGTITKCKVEPNTSTISSITLLLRWGVAKSNTTIWQHRPAVARQYRYPICLGTRHL